MEIVDRQYTDLGILYMETRSKNGQFHGLQQFWHFTGEKISRFFCHQGNNLGICQFWNINDTRSTIEQFRDQRHGIQIKFKYENRDKKDILQKKLYRV